jgi:hypothetical protein
MLDLLRGSALNDDLKRDVDLFEELFRNTV